MWSARLNIVTLIMFILYTIDLSVTKWRQFIHARDIGCATSAKTFAEIECMPSFQPCSFIRVWQMLAFDAMSIRTKTVIFTNQHCCVKLDGQPLKPGHAPMYLEFTLGHILSYKP